MVLNMSRGYLKLKCYKKKKRDHFFWNKLKKKWGHYFLNEASIIYEYYFYNKDQSCTSWRWELTFLFWLDRIVTLERGLHSSPHSTYSFTILECLFLIVYIRYSNDNNFLSFWHCLVKKKINLITFPFVIYFIFYF